MSADTATGERRTEVLLTEERDGVLIITLNRPSARNALDAALSAELVRAVALLNSRPDLHAGVLTGAGGVFCSGMDLKAFASSGLPDGLGELLRTGSADKPLIAAVEGYALAGGLELALACDLIVAARGARLGIPEAKVGLFAAGGGLLRLPQRIPSQVALEMAITGRPIDGERAFQVGLVSRATDEGEALEAAIELAASIVRCAPLSVRASRELVRAVHGRGDAEFWELQAPLVRRVFTSDDAKEGPAAFAQKRAPRWSGA
ncbi:crotonase/enoyl-CoA hydratase family protein [Pseudonocardia spinosispora]|uniref:crotonase/enoyl-CoA hydratase family protein n=1 Tax=Pseudonocardia spinosispora TaxID=103441 RepID=UPI0004140A56|nr:crotonase/enoyl-CoA hydratase family protein [Pseudonocardia spinosispora]